MEKSLKTILSVLLLASSNLACTTTHTTNHKHDLTYSPDEIIIFADGRVHYRQRLLSHDDVLIYNDIRGVEKAAVKMRTGVQPDYYLGSYTVVRPE